MKRPAESPSDSSTEILLDRINLSEADRAAAKVALRHGEAIANAIYRVIEWFDRKAHRAQQRELESYLAQSTDHADLERRMRQIMYGGSRLRFG